MTNLLQSPPPVPAPHHWVDKARVADANAHQHARREDHDKREADEVHDVPEAGEELQRAELEDLVELLPHEPRAKRKADEREDDGGEAVGRGGEGVEVGADGGAVLEGGWRARVVRQQHRVHSEREHKRE
eukprot:30890-Chlamydomonas_euryale.AAC.1